MISEIDASNRVIAIRDIRRRISNTINFVGLLGIEPSLRAPKARVLPVYDSPAVFIIRRGDFISKSPFSISGLAAVSLLFGKARSNPFKR